MCANRQSDRFAPREGYILVENARLYYREVGLDAQQNRQPIVVLHGGPDFDHSYLLPDMDRLADSFRLIYYDQRGRGKSADNVQPEEVTIESEIEDLEGVREYFQLESVAVLGHSWGGLLAMEYAIRHPDRVSHLILMNTAPASHDGWMLLRKTFREKRPAADAERMKALASSTEYEEGDPDTFAEYCRSHFRMTVKRPEQLERLVESLRLSFTKEGVLKARAIEERLSDQTWRISEYDLLPRLRQLSIATLIIHGDYDFIPVECAAHIAEVMPDARFVVLRDCGHFSYIERPEEVRKEITDFFERTQRTQGTE